MHADIPIWWSRRVRSSASQFFCSWFSEVMFSHGSYCCSGAGSPQHCHSNNYSYVGFSQTYLLHWLQQGWETKPQSNLQSISIFFADLLFLHIHKPSGTAKRICQLIKIYISLHKYRFKKLCQILQVFSYTYDHISSINLLSRQYTKLKLDEQLTAWGLSWGLAELAVFANWVKRQTSFSLTGSVWHIFWGQAKQDLPRPLTKGSAASQAWMQVSKRSHGSGCVVCFFTVNRQS